MNTWTAVIFGTRFHVPPLAQEFPLSFSKGSPVDVFAASIRCLQLSYIFVYEDCFPEPAPLPSVSSITMSEEKRSPSPDRDISLEKGEAAKPRVVVASNEYVPPSLLPYDFMDVD